MARTPFAFAPWRAPAGHHRRMRPVLSFETLEVRQLFTTTTSPFTIINQTTGYSDGALAYFDTQIQIALYAQDYTSGDYYYFDKDGNAYLTTGITPVDNVQTIPTFALSQMTKTAEHTYVIDLPQMLGTSNYGLEAARMYFSVDSPIVLTVNGDGSVNDPVPGDTFFDFIEFSLNAPDNPTGNLNIDTTNVDQFGVPIKVVVDSSDPANIPGGVGISQSRLDVINLFRDFTSDASDPYAICIWPNSDPTWGSYRILNPSGVLSQAEVATNKIQVETTLLGAIGATDTNIHIYSTGAFPSTTPFNIRIFTEEMTVTSITPQSDGTAMWTVTRGVNGIHAGHVNGALIAIAGPAMTETQTSLTVLNTVGFPTSYPFDIRVGNEIMTVTGLKSNNHDGTTTWNVLRAQAGSSAASYNQDTIVYYESVTNLGLNSYFNSAIDALFELYNGTGSKLQIKSDADSNVYEGVVATDANGAYVMHFTPQGNPSGTAYDVYYPFFIDNRYYWAGYTPKLTVSSAPLWAKGANVASLSPSEMVFACNGVFADNKYRPAGDYTTDQLKVLADLEDQMVSALNRGVGTLPGYNASSNAGTWRDQSQYYNQTGTVWNRYAEFLHRTVPASDEVSIGGLNYGFPFDDSTGQASDIGVSSFNSVTVTLTAWGNLPPKAENVSARLFLSSYLATHWTPLPQDVEASSQLVVADPQVAPLAAVDAALDATNNDDAFYLAHYATENDSDEELAEQAPSYLSSLFSLRELLGSHLAN